MRLSWEARAWDDYMYWLSQDKKTLRRLNHFNREDQLVIATGSRLNIGCGAVIIGIQKRQGWFST